MIITDLTCFLRDSPGLFRLAPGSLRGHPVFRQRDHVLTAFVHDITCRIVTEAALDRCLEADSAFVPAQLPFHLWHTLSSQDRGIVLERCRLWQ
jgi:hypothetical protein